MDAELLNRLGALQLYAFFDESKNMLTIHFINEEENKPDLMAYMLFNKSWDVREVINETSQLTDDKDIVEIHQNRVGIFEQDSSFDKLVKKAIQEISDTQEESETLTQVIKALFNG